MEIGKVNTLFKQVYCMVMRQRKAMCIQLVQRWLNVYFSSFRKVVPAIIDILPL
jgi:hypothetical protein